MSPDPEPPSLAAVQKAARDSNRRAREQLALRARALAIAVADRKKRLYIEAGLDHRQPPEYRGRAFDHADRDGVHPSAFPPMRNGPQDGLSEEFIAFQAYNQTRIETHPDYYCPRCKIRYNARDGALCGPCVGAKATQAEYPT